MDLRYPEEELVRLDSLAVEADLYLLKSDTELALSLAIALERLGGRVLNHATASAAAKDKVMAAGILLQAGLPTPRSLAAASPALLAGALVPGPLILKPQRGYHGAGLAVATTTASLAEADAYPDLVFAQQFLINARRDLKVFVIGDEVFGTRKSFSPDSYTQPGTPTTLSAEVESIARRCGEAFGLELYGLDLAEAHTGAYVVDLNYFPGYRGVPDAASRLAEHILRALGH